jgi:hypothetical protein
MRTCVVTGCAGIDRGAVVRGQSDGLRPLAVGKRLP